MSFCPLGINSLYFVVSLLIPFKKRKERNMSWIDKDTISLEWSTLDVKQQLIDRNKKEKLNIEECREVLDRCLRRHDATMGLSWDIMDIHIDDVLEERSAS